jgi:hypothetical protein
MQDRRNDAGRVAEGHAIARGGKDNGHPNQDGNPIKDEGSKFCHAGWKQGEREGGNANVQILKSKFEIRNSKQIRIRKQDFTAQCRLLFMV